MKKTTSLSLIQKLISDPALVQQVRALNPHALARVVDEVGLEDAGPVVSLATTEQLTGIFDRDLWKNILPGEEELFDADRFSTWLSVLLSELGSERLAKRIVTMDFDFLSFAFSQLSLVVNLDAMTLIFSETGGERSDLDQIEKALESSATQEFEEFAVISKGIEGWDDLITLFLEFDKNHSSFFRRLLERMEYLSNDYIEDNGGLYDVLVASEQIAGDVGFEREKRLESQGFVTAISAREFFSSIRKQTLDGLLAQKELDPVSQGYFRNLSTQRANPPQFSKPGAKKVGLLERISNDQEVNEAPVPQLPSGGIASEIEKLSHRDFDLYQRKLQELAYLSNLVLAGISKGEDRYRPAEAAEEVLSCLESGLKYLSKKTRQSSEQILESQSLISIFQLAWKLKEEQ